MILELLITTGLGIMGQSTEVRVEKEVVYQKNQVVDLSGSHVEGENQNPPAFFVTKMQTPNAKSLLQERLDAVKLRDFNLMGF